MWYTAAARNGKTNNAWKTDLKDNNYEIKAKSTSLV